MQSNEITNKQLADMIAEQNRWLADATKYEVIVGNIGTVHTGSDLDANIGRAAGESVTLMEDGEPTGYEYTPDTDD